MHHVTHRSTQQLAKGGTGSHCHLIKPVPRHGTCHHTLLVTHTKHTSKPSVHASSSSSHHSLEPVALDVEYAQLRRPDGSHCTVAAWVCIVAPDQEQPLLKTYCRHPMLDNMKPSHAAGTAHQPLRSIGGVKLASLHGAPVLADVAAKASALWQGRLLVGHGLAKDMAALGMSLQTISGDVAQPYYDTITFPPFQRKDGSTYSLRRLVQDHLGQSIHGPGALHDPEVDARAVLRLYMEVARPKLINSYDDLVQHYLKQFLAQAQMQEQE